MGYRHTGTSGLRTCTHNYMAFVLVLMANSMSAYYNLLEVSNYRTFLGRESVERDTIYPPVATMDDLQRYLQGKPLYGPAQCLGTSCSILTSH
jgi:hypothetical protein